MRGGAATALVVAGETVVDLWAGTAVDGDPADDADVAAARRAWTERTRAVIFSSSKGLVALCVLDLVRDGRLELDAPVATYWPTFAQHGKGSVTVREALAHRAGVPVVDAIHTREQVLSWRVMVDGIAAQSPLWEPGAAYEYHALTYLRVAGRGTDPPGHR